MSASANKSCTKQHQQTAASKVALVNVAETVNNNNSNNSSFTSGSVETNNVSEIPRTPPPASFIATSKTRSLRTGILPLIAIPFRNNRIYAIVGDSWGYHLDFTAGSCNIDEGESPLDGAIRECIEETKRTIVVCNGMAKDTMEELNEMWQEVPFEPISDCYGLAHVRSVCFEDDTHVREQVLFLANVCDPPSIRRKPIDAEHFISQVKHEVCANTTPRNNNNNRRRRHAVVSDPILPCPMVNDIFNERHVCVERSREALEHNHFFMVPVYPPLSPAETEIVSRKYFCTHYFATQQQKDNLKTRKAAFFSTLQQVGIEMQKQAAKNSNNNKNTNNAVLNFYTPITWCIDDWALRRKEHRIFGSAIYGWTVKTCAVCNKENVYLFHQDHYCRPAKLPRGYVSKVTFHSLRYFAIEISDSQTDKVVGVCHPRFTPVQDFEQEDRTRGFWINFVGVDASILKQCLRVPAFFLSGKTNIIAIMKDLHFDEHVFSNLASISSFSSQAQQWRTAVSLPQSQAAIANNNNNNDDADDDVVDAAYDHKSPQEIGQIALQLALQQDHDENVPEAKQ